MKTDQNQSQPHHLFNSRQIQKFNPTVTTLKQLGVLQTANGRPFFWLADTAWTLPNNLTREQAAQYFENRRKKGFSVIQIVTLNPETDPQMRSAYGERALHRR